MVVQSWYKCPYILETDQEMYINMLQDSFCVPSPYGDPMPYIMTDYQKEFHTQSINILKEDAYNILFDKSRGISFTFSSLIDMIVTAASFRKQIVPIVAHRKETGQDILENAKWLCRNCKMKEIKYGVKFSERGYIIHFTHTDSKIQVFPGGNNADALRSARLIRGMLDEFAFQNQDEALFKSAMGAMVFDIGQWVIGSTPNGTQNKYHELTAKCHPGLNKEIGFYFFSLPLFDPQVFNPSQNILTQVQEKGLVPIAPWIDLKRAEEKRAIDVNVFLQEHQTSRLDDSISFISTKAVMEVTNPDNKNLREQFGTIYETENNVILGYDFAEVADFFSITAFELISVEEGLHAKQIYLDYFVGKTTPEIEEYVNSVLQMFPTWLYCKGDSTGPGIGLSRYLQRTHGNKVEAINFSSSMDVGEKQKAGVRPLMITNLKSHIQSKQVTLLSDAMQLAHLTAMDYALQIPRDKKRKGHGDILFADALALLGFGQLTAGIRVHSYNPSQAKRDESEKKGFEGMTIEEKLQYMRYLKKNKHRVRSMI